MAKRQAQSTAKKPAQKQPNKSANTTAAKKVSTYQKAVNKLYNAETKRDKKTYNSAVKSFQMDAEYNKPGAARKKNNKAFGITNPTDRIASTPTAKVYNVNNHYKQAISGVFKNANTMVKGQKAVNQKNAAETIRAAVDAGNDANHQNDVRYNQAKHVVAKDSATTKNKLSVNHAQNLNKITTNTTANVSSAEATKDKANANSLEKYYNFKGTTLKNMKLNRISKTQEQKNNDKSLAAAYKQTRISASQARKKRNYAHKETMRGIATNKYDTIAKSKYKDVASVDKAIKELKGKKGVKYKIDKLTSLYNIRASLVGSGTSTRSGSSGRRSGGGRGRSGRRSYYHRSYGGRSGGSYGGYRTVGGGSGGGRTGGSGGGSRKSGGGGGNSFNLYRATVIRNNSVGRGVNSIKGGNAAEREYARGHGGGIQKGPGVHRKKRRNSKKNINNNKKVRTILIGR